MENLVYVKKNSITGDLIDDFLEIYESSEEDADNEDNQDILMINPDCKKFRSFLFNEIQQEVVLYFNGLNHSFGEKTVNYQWRNNISSFSVVQNKNRNGEKNFEVESFQKNVEKFRKNEIKMFYFIWFLNDFDEKFIFPNGQTAFHDKGSLLIVPCSPFFPFYTEQPQNAKQENYLNITGYIFVNEGTY